MRKTVTDSSMYSILCRCEIAAYKKIYTLSGYLIFTEGVLLPVYKNGQQTDLWSLNGRQIIDSFSLTTYWRQRFGERGWAPGSRPGRVAWRSRRGRSAPRGPCSRSAWSRTQTQPIRITNQGFVHNTQASGLNEQTDCTSAVELQHWARQMIIIFQK